MESESSQSSISLLDYWRIIWERKWLILIVAAAAFAASIWNSTRSVPVYEATASIQLLGNASSTIIFGDRPQSGGVFIPTTGLAAGIEIIKSRMVAGGTAIRLGKHYDLKPLPPGTSFKLLEVLITEEARPGEYTLKFIDDVGNYVLLDPNGRQIGAGRPGQRFSAEGISFALSDPSSKAGVTAHIVFHSLPEVADRLRNVLTLSSIPETNLIALRVRTSDPEEAARIANAFGETYEEFSREEKIRNLQNMRKFLKEQIASLRQDLLKTGEALAGSGVQKREAESIVGLLARDHPITGGGSQRLAQQLLNLEVQRALLLYRYTANHPIVDQIDREIANVRDRFGKQLRVSQQDIKLRDLLRDAELKAGLYAQMIEREWGASIAEASETGSARIIDRALPPKAPIAPNIQRNLTFGSMLALSLGVGVALLMNFLDTSVKNVQDVEERVGLPIFGVIPQISNGRRNNFLNLGTRKGQRDDPAAFLLDINVKRSWASEAYRSLRTNIQFAVPEEPARVFLFTSPGPSEGKSLTVANLAITVGQMDKRVLVVDADFRRPVQQKLFQARGDSGLAEVLTRNRPWREVIQSTVVNEHVDLVTSGRTPPNPPDLLARSAFYAFLDEAKQHYDMIFIDSPPVLLFTDACVLGRFVSGVFLVVRANVTGRETIVRAQSQLGAVNAKIIGVILNSVTNPDRFRYYRYYSYYTDSSDSETQGKSGWVRMRRNVGRFLSRITRI